ncbi:hypothetical protein EBT16_14440, partial [bacterium]|nr:hypothetical protein [bacterium]
HLDRLIGQHLCLELEEQANVFLEPIFKRAFPRHQRFFPLEQISALVLALDLDKKLAEQLESMIEKKKEAFNWGKEISDSWLVDLNQSFLSARESLQRLFETNEETSQAA